ncbi:MAG TPA: hypothetical protein VE011_04090 [Candidatus Dormibacteraeota bacterium]|nr:hypothetical protein [Candidatus Dormibacteraeota bacterium]
MLGRTPPGTALVVLALTGAVALAVILAASIAGIIAFVLASVALVVLILPGIVLAITRRPVESLRRLDLFLVASALSLGCIAIGGLVLNLIPGGLSRTAWLGLVAVLLLAIAVFARRGLPPLRRESWVRPTNGQALAMVAACVLMMVSLLIARAGVKQPSEPFSALWVVPAGSGMVKIGLDNQELATTTYRVDVTVGGIIQRSFPAITVAMGERWTTLVPQPARGGPPLEVLVYVASQPDVVYRRVTYSTGTGSA